MYLRSFSTKFIASVPPAVARLVFLGRRSSPWQTSRLFEDLNPSGTAKVMPIVISHVCLVSGTCSPMLFRVSVAFSARSHAHTLHTPSSAVQLPSVNTR